MRRVTFKEEDNESLGHSEVIKDEALKQMDLHTLLRQQEEQTRMHERMLQEQQAKDLSMKEQGLKFRHHQR